MNALLAAGANREATNEVRRCICCVALRCSDAHACRVSVERVYVYGAAAWLGVGRLPGAARAGRARPARVWIHTRPDVLARGVDMCSPS